MRNGGGEFSGARAQLLSDTTWNLFPVSMNTLHQEELKAFVLFLYIYNVYRLLSMWLIAWLHAGWPITSDRMTRSGGDRQPKVNTSINCVVQSDPINFVMTDSTALISRGLARKYFLQFRYVAFRSTFDNCSPSVTDWPFNIAYDSYC